MALSLVPHVPGKTDCWWVVTEFYKRRFGIDVVDRGAIEPGPEGIREGYEGATDWVRVDSPAYGDIVLMASGVGRKRVLPGHVGVYLGDERMIHSVEGVGVRVEPLTEYQTDIMGFMRHVERTDQR